MPRTQVSPLKKPPQSPEEVDTKFMLLTRDNSSVDHYVKYLDAGSFMESNFEPQLPCRIIVHGFKGSGKDKGVLNIAAAFLSSGESNVIIVDWKKGAAGPSYVAAASNTQLVGRQVALLISDIVTLGTRSSAIHIVGFSLGAHIAGYAGRSLQEKGIIVGRITGLDPASILFRELLSTSLSPLGKGDAKFVDVIHTDGTRFLSEGLGIFRPIGHSDYFPNGGINQPGCNHVRGAVIASHFGGGLKNVSLVCNHIRAWQLFHESIKSEDTGCEFTSFPCPGGWTSFQRGNCFPSRCQDTTCTRMGYPADQNKILGPLYLVTRDSSPFCGYQLKASVRISKSVPKVRGYLQLSLVVQSEQTNFNLYSEFRDELRGDTIFHGLAAARYGTVSPNDTPVLNAHVSFNRITKEGTGQQSQFAVAIDEVTLQDVFGNVWRFHDSGVVLQNNNGTVIDVVVVELKLQTH